MKKEDLLKTLKAVIEGTGSIFVLFDGGRVVSFGESISVSCPLETGLDCVVWAENLFDAIRRMDDELELTVKNDKMVVTDTRTKLTLNKIEEKDVVKLKADIASLQSDGLEWQKIPEGFTDALTLSLFSAGEKDVGQIYSGVAFRGSDVLSTDNFRISHCILGSSFCDKTLRIKKNTADKLVKIGCYDQFAIRRPWLFFKTVDGITVAARLMAETNEDQYPFDVVMAMFNSMGFDKADNIQTLPEDLKFAIERVEVMASISSIDHTTQIIFEKKDATTLVLRATKDVGEIETTVPWSGTLIDPIIGSPSFLKKIISITKTFKINPTGKALLFQSHNFEHLILVQPKIVSALKE